MSAAPGVQESALLTAETPNDDGYYAVIELNRIRNSPDNRKRFNAVALTELAASIKDIGVAQPILLRPVVPTVDQPEEFEIVAGERRFRASGIAGLPTIPAMIRVLTDLQAAKIRILENLQRENPHPMEEAEGYQQLMLKHGYTADQLAEEIKKSRSYVFGRLKLCALTIDVREHFLDEKISPSIALLIARIPLPSLQIRALGDIEKPQLGGPALSYRDAHRMLQQRYMLDLGTAIFDRSNAKLVAGAGTCGKCPKRTGNQPEIFPELSADVCTDPDCFGEKRAAHFETVLALAAKNGVRVFEGEERYQIIQKLNNASFEYVSDNTYIHTFPRNHPDTGNSGFVRTRLTKDQLPPVAAYLKHDDESVTPIYSRDAVLLALEKAGVCETVKAHADRMEKIAVARPPELNAITARQQANLDAEAKIESAAAAETAFRIALYREVRSRGATKGFNLTALREFVKLSLGAYSLPDELADLYSFDHTKEAEVASYIDEAGLPEIQLLLIDMAVGEMLTVPGYQFKYGHHLNDGFGGVAAMARAEYIDPEIVMRDVPDKPFLDYASMDAAKLEKALAENPYRINDIRSDVISARSDLVKGMDKAATALGYQKSMCGYYVRPSEELGPRGADAVEIPAAPAVNEMVGDDVVIKGEDLAAALAEPARIKAPKGKKAAVKAEASPKPAAAWPFPKTNDGASPATGEGK